MTRGRKPLPAAVRRLNGNPGKRPIVEPVTIAAEAPQPPHELDARSAHHWERLSHMLNGVGLLTRLDGDALAGYCENLTRRERLNRTIAQQGDFIEARDGIKKHPAWTILKQIEDAMAKFQSEYGLTASARMKVKAPAKEADAPEVGSFDEFMREKAKQEAL
jgi:P27 family predicted phage terminase small subunit